ncbi:MAG: hypothetical protein V7641_5011 [Blastocatellia bacterium]
MDIANRLSRIEQAVNTRLSALMRPDDQLELDYDYLRRVAEYAGFPVPSKDQMVSQWRDHDRQCARLMLATDCGVEESAVQTLLDDPQHQGTKEEAWRALDEMSRLREAVRLDMESGKPGDQSEAGNRLRVLLMQ